MKVKKLRLSLLFVVVLLFGSAVVAFGDWDPCDPYKMHWPQLPDPCGWDIAFCREGPTELRLELADDWQCTKTGPVSDIHFWTSWKGDLVGTIESVMVCIYSNDPNGPYGWSEPNELLWSRYFPYGNYTIRPYGSGQQGWYDPNTGMWIKPDHYNYYQINITDINDPFIQEEGKIYWLGIHIKAVPFPTCRVGWKTALPPKFMDCAVWRVLSTEMWTPLRDPITYKPLDLSFVITGQEEPGIKWEQLPDETPNGIDIRVDSGDDGMMPRIIADDFNCTQSGIITDVHFWGSWKYDMKGEIARIHLSIHSDDPAGPGGTDPNNPYSQPDELLWAKDFFPGEFTEEPYATLPPDGEWWYDPLTGELMPNADWTIWQYNICIDPNEAFHQTGNPENPKIYWLDIQVDTNDGYGEFGWKTRDINDGHFNDDAVFSIGYGPPFMWQELRYPPRHPYYGRSIDLAFAITTEKEPNIPEPKGLVAHSKWSQPPIEIDPNSTIPRYCGWDELSKNRQGTPPTKWKIVADDYRCIGSMPVTSIHWWGSFFDWEWSWAHGTLPPVLPANWWIGFWSNVPAGAEPNHLPYSYPNKLLHSITIPANRVAFEEVGSDEYYGYYPTDICYQYNVDLNSAEVFRQDDFNAVTYDNIYWISIVAEYNVPSVSYPWGWKTRPWSWMDDAVTFTLPSKPSPNYVTNPSTVNPIKDPEWGESFDVAFELDTDPNYIKWEQRYTGIRNWPHYEDVNSMFSIWNPNPMGEQLVADDWRCVRRTPVTAIVWWGSYIGYGYEACSGQGPTPRPIPPAKFRLMIWTDVPADDPCNIYEFSHPGRSIWQYDAAEYDEVLVGYDKHPHGEPNEPVFRYSVMLPEEEWFHQPDYNGVFWLSVQAVYDVNMPNYDWGWTNHKHVFNDDAVRSYIDPNIGHAVWRELYDQTGASEDMSFMLFTDPNVCSTCANYNCDARVNFVDYADFADDWLWTGPAGGYNNSDLDCNGIVDFYDLKIFVDQWLDSCP